MQKEDAKEVSVLLVMGPPPLVSSVSSVNSWGVPQTAVPRVLHRLHGVVMWGKKEKVGCIGCRVFRKQGVSLGRGYPQ